MAKQPAPLFSKKEWAALMSTLELPKRQAEILWFMFDGQSDKAIARRLGLAMPTVRTHLRRLFQRFDVPDRTALVIEVFRRFRINERDRQSNQINDMPS